MKTTSKFPLQSTNRSTYYGISPHICVRSEGTITKRIWHQEPLTPHTVLIAIVILCLTAFFNYNLRAQVVAADNFLGTPSERAGARECSITVLGGPGATGDTLACAYCRDVNHVLTTVISTSYSTNAGTTWTTVLADDAFETPSYSYDNGLDPYAPDGDSIVNPKVVFRPQKWSYYADGQPELIMVYRATEVSGGGEGEGVYLAFSSDLGNDWDTPVPIESHDGTDNLTSLRPSIAIDNNSGNVYILWSTTWVEDGPPIDSVYVSMIAPNSHSVSTPKLITSFATNYGSRDNTGNYSVDGCDIAVDENGHIFALWRETVYAIPEAPDLETLKISVSTNEGTSWATHNEISGAPTPVNTLIFRDYPCLAISASSCASDSIYIAYTQGLYTGTPAVIPNTSNPSELYLASGSLSSSGFIGPFRTYNTQADAATPNPTGNTFQFEPELCSDGEGGVFLLYYSSSPNSPYSDPQAMLYESGLHGRLIALPNPDGNSKLDYGMFNYIGIAWDPVKELAHPAWTDLEVSNPHPFACIFSESVSGALTGGTNPSPGVGDLGFSNQRRVVMIGSSAHLVGYTPNPTPSNPYQIMYSQQTSNSNNTSDYWTNPIQLDNNDAVNPKNAGKQVALSYPSVGVYQSSNSSSQKAIAVVWSSIPKTPNIHTGALSVAPNTTDPYIYIRVKEFEDCETGSLSDWSPVDSIAVPDASVSGLSSRVVVSPLTVPTTPSPNRYLIGWVISYPTSGKEIHSVTYLRGNQAGSEGSDPTTNVETENENWGPQNWPLHPTRYANKWTANISTLVAQSGNYPINASSFVTSTSHESNGNGTPAGPNDDSEEVVFSGDGTMKSTGVYDVNAMYVTTAGMTLSFAGTNLGEAQGTTTPINSLHPYTAYVPRLISLNPICPTCFASTPVYYYDRNPSVTVTSSGQKLVAWERMVQSGPIGIGGGIHTLSLNYDYQSEICAVQTLQGGGWSTIKDIIGEPANDPNFFNHLTINATDGWLLNPSITSFPKTPLQYHYNSTSDQDPGAAELLFWQQDSLETGSGKTVVNDLLEWQFDETTQGMPWTGKWKTVQKAWYPIAYPYEYIGANSQRSLGMYNNGPRFHTDGTLRDDNGLAYVQGLSYGIGNAFASGSIQPTLSMFGPNDVPDVGALKGTFDTALGVQLYRSEARVKDSSMVSFKWGKVYVEDTALGLPVREVMLHDGQPDSTGYASTTAMRDSIFSTEWFNWPVSAEIHYDRLMLAPRAGTLATAIHSKIDTTVIYDTVSIDTTVSYDTVETDSVMTYYSVITGTAPVFDTFYDSSISAYAEDTVAFYYTTVLDSGMALESGYIDTAIVYDTVFGSPVSVYDTIYDTVPGTFTADTNGRSDSSFYASGTQMKYTVQLIHTSGHIDTVEQAIYNPHDSLFITPMAVHIVNAGTAADTVRLRVIGDFTNVPDADTLVEFARETMLTAYPTYSDTTIAIGTGGGVLPPPDTCFYVAGPYPNPSTRSGDNVSILVHYCSSGSTITAQVYNIFGSPVGSAVTFTSDAQVWDRLEIPAPYSAGPYFIHINVGAFSSIVGYSVF